MILEKYIALFILVFSLSFVAKAEDENPQMSASSKTCVQCHGGKHYTIYNDFSEMDERKFMNPHFIIDTLKYLKGVHQTFSCDDCHSPEYETYPHASELKLEPQYTCLDCHGGDKHFAHLHFDEIDQEVQNSVHVESFGTGFKCEMCHDPHSYKMVARNNDFKIKEVVSRNNAMCLSCHNDKDAYQILSDNDNPKLIEAHNWLPNQAVHFKSVRCIECHTPTDDTLMVSHKILPKTQAVRKCTECHSTSSILSDQLYKYRAKENRSSKGFYNSLIMNEAYVIGANRNKYLNNISLLLFGLTLGGIFIHILMRIFKGKKHGES